MSKNSRVSSRCQEGYPASRRRTPYRSLLFSNDPKSSEGQPNPTLVGVTALTRRALPQIENRKATARNAPLFQGCVCVSLRVDHSVSSAGEFRVREAGGARDAQCTHCGDATQTSRPWAECGGPSVFLGRGVLLAVGGEGPFRGSIPGSPACFWDALLTRWMTSCAPAQGFLARLPIRGFGRCFVIALLSLLDSRGFSKHEVKAAKEAAEWCGPVLWNVRL